MIGQIFPVAIPGPNGSVNSISGATYTIQASDCGKLVVIVSSNNNTGACNITLPSPTTAGFGPNFVFDIQCEIPVATISMAGGATIDGGSSLTLGSTQGARIFSDGTNYSSQRGFGLVPGSGVIGKAIFNGIGGIANTVYSGVVSSVTRNSTGKYTVNLTGSPSNYSIALSVSSDTSFARFIYLDSTGTPATQLNASSFPITVLGLNSGSWVVQDSGCITVTLYT